MRRISSSIMRANSLVISEGHVGRLLSKKHESLINVNDFVYKPRAIDTLNGVIVACESKIEVLGQPTTTTSILDLKERRKELLNKVKYLGEREPLFSTLYYECLMHESPNNWWYWGNVATAKEDATKVSFPVAPEEALYDMHRRRSSWSKFLSRSVAEGLCYFTEADINTMANAAGSYLYQYHTFELTSEITKGYNRRGITRWSCMSGRDRRPYLAFYDMNSPEKVELLLVKCMGKVVGRALVWHTDQGYTIMDLVYPKNNGPHVNAAKGYAEQQGWLYRGDQYDNVVVTPDGDPLTVTVRHQRIFPYLDTFRYTKNYMGDHEVITLNSKSGYYSFTHTHGNYSTLQTCLSCYGKLDECSSHRMVFNNPNKDLFNDDGLYCYRCVEKFVLVDYSFNGQEITGYYPKHRIVMCGGCNKPLLSGLYKHIDGVYAHRCDDCYERDIDEGVQLTESSGSVSDSTTTTTATAYWEPVFVNVTAG